MSTVLTEPSSLPSGEGGCDQLPGPALVDFELVRQNLSRPESIIDGLFESSRESWKLLQSEPRNRVLWRQEFPDRFRYSIALARKGVTSAIDVRRQSHGILETHAHLIGPRRLDCAIHRYSVSSEAGAGRLAESVEIRSTSRVFRFYRRRMVRDAVRSASQQLDELIASLQTF